MAASCTRTYETYSCTFACSISRGRHAVPVKVPVKIPEGGCAHHKKRVGGCASWYTCGLHAAHARPPQYNRYTIDQWKQVTKGLPVVSSLCNPPWHGECGMRVSGTGTAPSFQADNACGPCCRVRAAKMQRAQAVIWKRQQVNHCDKPNRVTPGKQHASPVQVCNAERKLPAMHHLVCDARPDHTHTHIRVQMRTYH